jgi:hypothetical protein
MAVYIPRLRSPFFINKTASSTSGSADMTITINSVDQYVVSKNTTSDAVSFEVSELIRDYLDITWDGLFPYSSTTKNSLTIYAVIKIEFYVGTKAERALNPSTPRQTITDEIYGFDAYSEFKEGVNKQITSGQLLQTNTVMYLPETGNSYIPYEVSNGVTYYTVADTVTDGSTVSVAGINIIIKRICEPIFDILKVVFVNKYGALQEFYFNKKNIQSLNVKDESYKSTLLANNTYSTLDHQKYKYNKQASNKITVNTGYVDEGQFEPIKEMMLSELVWMQIGSIVYPVNVVSNSLEKKTKTNDKLVNYSLDLEFAYDVINNVR